MSSSAEDAGPSGDSDAGDGALPDTSTTELSGQLGSLGELQPITSSFVISNSGETLVYLSTAPISCELLMMEGGKWLGTLPAGSQVVEIVTKGIPRLGSISVGKVEINYAPGGKSSAYEKSAHTGSVVFTKSAASGVVEGIVTATYVNPDASVMGTFHAEFCPGGQEY